LNLPVTTSRVVTSLHSTRYNDAVESCVFAAGFRVWKALLQTEL